MLFVPHHGPLHSALLAAKEKHKYFNSSPRYSSKYKETHLSDFRSHRDVNVAKDWIDEFVKNTCYFRAIVIDWSIWKGKYFGHAHEPEALLKRRAYKKWAEMLLHPELKSPTGGRQIIHANLYLDRLLITYGYDVIEWLKDRFTDNYRGTSPYIDEFQHTDSRKDANQCLQLCDLLCGSIFQALVPSTKREKLETRDYLLAALEPFGVKGLDKRFWGGYHRSSINSLFPKFSEWYWKPTEEGKKASRNRWR